MNMAMGEELLAVKRDINKRVRAYGESPNMRELAKRYSDIEQRMRRALDAAMNLIWI